MVSADIKRVANWAPIEGIWKQDPDSMCFFGVGPSEDPSKLLVPRGIALSGIKFSNGTVKTTITLSEGFANSTAHVLLGFSPPESAFVTAGIGGYASSYSATEWVPRLGFRHLESAGSPLNLVAGRPYEVIVSVDGQRLVLVVDGITVVNHVLREPIAREQVGLYVQSEVQVQFGSVEVSSSAPTAFVVMQFTDQFDELFDEVIRPVCENTGIKARRASDIYRPGVVLQDILQGLNEAGVVIADVTPDNRNVYYELGYSHALNKPVILLAERNTALPFDISGYRVIFYDNTIGGKSAVEADLRRHLTSILGE